MKYNAAKYALKLLSLGLIFVCNFSSAGLLCEDGDCLFQAEFKKPGYIEVSHTEIKLIKNCVISLGDTGYIDIGQGGLVSGVTEQLLSDGNPIANDSSITFGENGRVFFDSQGYIRCEKTNINTLDSGYFSLVGASSVTIDGAELSAINIASINEVDSSLLEVFHNQLAELSIGDIQKPDYARAVMLSHDNAISFEAQTVNIKAWSSLSIGQFTRIDNETNVGHTEINNDQVTSIAAHKSRFITRVINKTDELNVQASCDQTYIAPVVAIDLYCLAVARGDNAGAFSDILDHHEENWLIAAFSETNSYVEKSTTLAMMEGGTLEAKSISILAHSEASSGSPYSQVSASMKDASRIVANEFYVLASDNSDTNSPSIIKLGGADIGGEMWASIGSGNLQSFDVASGTLTAVDSNSLTIGNDNTDAGYIGIISTPSKEIAYISDAIIPELVVHNQDLTKIEPLSCQTDCLIYGDSLQLKVEITDNPDQEKPKKEKNSAGGINALILLMFSSILFARKTSTPTRLYPY
ncbi:MAG: hypothetical protein HRU20_18020 [Pseudomonadales bacterium]|nr:hypothetical protein [Pseudomonadales bacterium]